MPRQAARPLQSARKRSRGGEDSRKPEAADSAPLIRNLPLLFVRLKAVRDRRGKIRDAVVLQSNPAFKRFLKRPRVSPEGRPISEIFPEAIETSAIPWLDLFRKALDQRGPVRHKGFASTTGRWIDVVLYRVGPDEIVGLASDITSQYEAEARLRESEARYRRIVETSLEGIWILDKDFRTTHVNAKAAEMIGIPAQKIVGRPATDFVFPEDLAEHKALMKTRREGGVSRYERRLRRHDGGERWALVSSVPVFDPDGAYSGSFHMLSDISGLKNTETALRNSEQLYRMLFEMESDALYLINADTERIEEANQAAVDLYGYSREEFLKKTGVDISAESEETAKRLRAGGVIVHVPLAWHRKAGGEVFPAEVSGRFFVRNGTRYVLVAVRDISERRRAEEELKAAGEATLRSERFLNDIIEQSPHAMWISDEKGTLIRINPACCALLDITPAEVVGKYNVLADNIVRDQDVRPLVERVFRNGETVRFELDYDSALLKGLSLEHSVVRRLAVTVFPVKDPGGRITNAVIQHQDITEETRLKKALQNSEKHFRALVESAPEAIYAQQGGKIVYANPAAVALFGARSPEEIIGTPMMDRLHPSFRPVIAERIRILDEERKDVPVLEEIYLRLDGSPVDVEVSAIPFTFEGRPGSLAFVRDISERKRIETALQLSEERHRLLFQHASLGIGYYDAEGRAVLFNEVASEHLGGNSEAHIGKTLEEIFPGEPGRLYGQRLRQVLMNGASAVFEDDVILPQKTYWFRSTYGVIRDESGKPTGVQIISEDITDKKAYEDSVLASLHQKELLLKEIHHRVKNNLQIVSSLLSHQSRQVRDPEVLALFKESQNRIRTMALVHDKLYRSRSLDKIDIGEYAESLILYLFQALQVDPQRIAWEKDIHRIDLDILTAIPLGLIINELVSNALKHAFPGDRSGKVRIALSRTPDGEIRLTVRDDGIGFPEEFDIEKSNSLGMQIVSMLTQQLDGTLSIVRDNGTAITVAFHEASYKPRA